MRNLLPLAALLFAALALPPTPTLAAEAQASVDAYVRDGPGSEYDVIDRLETGAYYDVLDCWWDQDWCLVGQDGDEIGWVRGDTLIGSAAKLRVTPFEFLSNPRDFFD